jgi:hypothetical protein
MSPAQYRYLRANLFNTVAFCPVGCAKPPAVFRIARKRGWIEPHPRYRGNWRVSQEGARALQKERDRRVAAGRLNDERKE